MASSEGEPTPGISGSDIRDEPISESETKISSEVIASNEQAATEDTAECERSTTTAAADTAGIFSKLSQFHDPAVPLAAGFVDGPRLTKEWPTRAEEYNELHKISKESLEKDAEREKKLEEATEAARKFQKEACDIREEFEAFKVTMEESNRTTLAKDRIFAQLDNASLRLAATSILFGEIALDTIPPSVQVVSAKGEVTVLEDGEIRRAVVQKGVEKAKDLLGEVAADLLMLAAPLAGGYRNPFDIPPEAVEAARKKEGGLSVENLKTAYIELTTANGPEERETIDVEGMLADDSGVQEIVRPRMNSPARSGNLRTAFVKKESTPVSGISVESDRAKKAPRAKREIKNEEDAKTRSSNAMEERDKKRRRAISTVIVEPTPQRIRLTVKKPTTAMLWWKHGHVVPEHADTALEKHQGESAMRCKTEHGTGWVTYGSKAEGSKQVNCPECNKKMTEPAPFYLPPNRIVYQLRLGWGIDERGNVLNEHGVTIDFPFNNITNYVDEGKNAVDGWKEGSTYMKIPVQEQPSGGKKNTSLGPKASEKVSSADSVMPNFFPGTRRSVTGVRGFKGYADNIVNVADFHVKRFKKRAPKFEEEIGGAGVLQVLLQGLLKEVQKNTSGLFDICKDWFIERDIREWNDDQSITKLQQDLGLRVRPKKRKAKEMKAEDDDTGFLGYQPRKNRKQSYGGEDDTEIDNGLNEYSFGGYIGYDEMPPDQYGL
ncbi:hypothetical protein PSPO01_04897 [Paraphaeosphaeria sporulosa]